MFNNHKGSCNRFGGGQRGICSEHLLAHFWENDHKELDDVCVQVIDVTNIRDPTCREAFWIDKLKTSVPLGLNAVEL